MHNNELMESLLFGPADFILTDSRVNFNLATLPHDQGFKLKGPTFSTEFKKIVQRDFSAVSPTYGNTFFTYFFLGSILTSTIFLSDQSLRKNNLVSSKMFVKVDAKNVIKLVYPIFDKANQEVKLSFRSIALTNEDAGEIFNIEQYKFTTEEMIELIRVLGLRQLPLFKTKFEWKVFKTFTDLNKPVGNQAATPKNLDQSFEVIWAEIAQNNILNELSFILETNLDIINFGKGSFYHIHTPENENIRRFLVDPFKLLSTSQSATYTKDLGVYLMTNMLSAYWLNAKMFGPKFMPAEHICAYVTGAIAMNLNNQFQLQINMKPPLPYMYVFSLLTSSGAIYTLTGSQTTINLNTPVTIGIVDNNVDFDEISEMINSKKFNSMWQSAATIGKHTAFILANFNENAEGKENIIGRLLSINQPLIPKLVQNIDHLTKVIQPDMLQKFLTLELKSIMQQLRTNDFSIVSNYLLGQIISTLTEDEVDATVSYPKYHFHYTNDIEIEKNVRTFLLAFPDFMLAINIIKNSKLIENRNYMKLKTFLDGQHRQYVIQDLVTGDEKSQIANILFNQIFHIDLDLDNGIVKNFPISNLPETSYLNTYIGHATQISHLSVDKFIKASGEGKTQLVSAKMSELLQFARPYLVTGEEIMAFLQGIFHTEFSILPVEEQLNKNKLLCLLKTNPTTVIMPGYIQEQIHNMNADVINKFLAAEGKEEKIIRINVISSDEMFQMFDDDEYRLPIPSISFDMSFNEDPDLDSSYVHIKIVNSELKSLLELATENELLAPEVTCSFEDGRMKRSSVTQKFSQHCLFTWEDIDQFNDEKVLRRSKNYIKVNSVKFFDYIRKNEQTQKTKIRQLFALLTENRMRLAKYVTGAYSEELIEMLARQHIFQKLSSAARISSAVTMGIMYKNIAIDLLHGDYGGAAMSTSLLGGNYLVSKGIDYLSKSKNILKHSSKLRSFSTFFKASRPFFRRFAAGYNVFSLYQSATSYAQNHDSISLAGTAESSTFLVIDTVEIGLELAGLESALNIFGPIGAVIGAIVFAGAEAYMVYEKLMQFDGVLHLTTSKYIEEATFTFFTGDIDQDLKDMVEEKQMNNYLANKASELLSNESMLLGKTYSAYIFPAYISHSNKLELEDHNVIILNEYQTTEWSLARPDEYQFSHKGARMLCYTSKYYACWEQETKLTFWQKAKNGISRTWDSFVDFFQKSDSDVNKRYKCEGSIGVIYPEKLFTSQFTNETNILIDLKNGQDTVVSFEKPTHLYLIGNGHKTILGNNNSDTFLFNGNVTSGLIDAQAGNNIADFSQYADDYSDHVLQMTMNGSILNINFRNKTIRMTGISVIKGRINNPDNFTASCFVRMFNGQGGSKQQPDRIYIPDQLCQYEMSILISDNSVVTNKALIGKFQYILSPKSQGVLLIQINMQNESCCSYTIGHEVIITTLNFTDFQTIRYVQNNGTLLMKSLSGVTIIINNVANTECLVHFGDGFTVIIDRSQILQAYLISSLKPEKLINIYRPVSNSLGIHLNLRSCNSSILISPQSQLSSIASSHGSYDTANVLINDKSRNSHLVSDGVQNIFVVRMEPDINQSIPFLVCIYTSSSIRSHNTVDVSDLLKNYEHSNPLIFGRDYIVERSSLASNDIEINLFKLVPSWNSQNKTASQKFATIILKNCIQTKSYERINVILRNPMSINLMNNSNHKPNDQNNSRAFQLIPIPLHINPFTDHSAIIIDPDHYLEPNLKINIFDVDVLEYKLMKQGANLILFGVALNVTRVNNNNPKNNRNNDKFFQIIFKQFYNFVSGDHDADVEINFTFNNLSVPLNWSNTKPEVIDNIEDQMKHYKRMIDESMYDNGLISVTIVK